MAEELTIRSFQSGDVAAFRTLNVEWIERYFKLEPKDEMTFADPQKTILGEGGHILMAVVDELAVGCCALLPIGKEEFEVAKMAVSPARQNLGVGRRLLAAAIQTARDFGCRRLYLETNHILTPAIRLYESLGFRHLDATRVVPSPYARADVYMELHLS